MSAIWYGDPITTISSELAPKAWTIIYAKLLKDIAPNEKALDSERSVCIAAICCSDPILIICTIDKLREDIFSNEKAFQTSTCFWGELRS